MEDSIYIYQNELEKASFEHSMSNGDLKQEQILIKCYLIKHLILLKFQKLIGIKEVLL